MNQNIKQTLKKMHVDNSNGFNLLPEEMMDNFIDKMSKLDLDSYIEKIKNEDNNVFPDVCPPIDNVHVTTYKSAKGLEFDTVILPDFGSMDYLCRKFDVLEWKDFYVAATRARTN